MSKNTCGPAFPVEKRWAVPNERFEGMTLRDYFAASFVSKIYEVIDSGGFVEAARLAYQMADAMIEEREK